MKEFVEKLIGRMEEIPTKNKCSECPHKKKCDELEAIIKDEQTDLCGATIKALAIEIVNELAEEYRATFMEELLEAKRNCGEDSYCSECPFGQVQDRCYLAELQIEGGNNGWIPCSKRLPKEHDSIFAECKGTNKWNEAMFEKISDDVNVTVKYENGTVKTMTTHTIDGKWKIDSIVKCEVIAWQPLPQPYEPKE